jgi:hypothetical protein
MADTVTSNVVFVGKRRRSVVLTGASDGTGEAGVVKVDRSALIGLTGSSPTKLIIEEVSWTIQGYTAITLAWEHTINDTALILGVGEGYMSFKDVGGLTDPGSAGGQGDIILTTAGHSAGDTYTITLVVRLKG